MPTSLLKKRILMTVIGVLLCGISVGFFKRAAFGVDPFQSLMSGLNAVIPISFGTLYMAANLLLLLFAFCFDRHYIGVATFVNLFLLGYVTEFTLYLLERALPELGIPGRAVLLVIGIVVLCLSSALYFTSDLGVSTYDAIALVMSGKWKVASFRVCRVGCDLVCVAGGAALFFLGGGTWSALPEIVGVGTIITAFFMGPLIELFNVHVARPLLYGRFGAAESEPSQQETDSPR